MSEDIKMNELNNTEDVQDINEVFSEEEIKARQELLDLAFELINSYRLDWTFRSINYIVNKENVTFNQLRSCVFKNTKGEVVYDYHKAVLLIIKSGLVGSKQIAENEKDKLEDRAYEIIEDWRDKFGYVGTLQILLINIMEKKHFFMGTQDLRVLELLSYQNLQPDLVRTQIALDMETKVNQSRSLQ